MNENGLMPLIYSPETNAELTLTLATLHLITLLQRAFLKILSLCTIAPLHNARPVLPSYSCSMLPPSLLGVNCLSFSLPHSHVGHKWEASD
jgi:hypothetical protein